MQTREQSNRSTGWAIVVGGAAIATVAAVGMVLGEGGTSTDGVIGDIRLRDASALELPPDPAGTSSVEVVPPPIFQPGSDHSSFDSPFDGDPIRAQSSSGGTDSFDSSDPAAPTPTPGGVATAGTDSSVDSPEPSGQAAGVGPVDSSVSWDSPNSADSA